MNLLRILRQLCKGKTHNEAMKVCQEWFGQAIWTLYKDQWDQLSDGERKIFVDLLRKR